MPPLIIITPDTSDDDYRTAMQALRNELVAGREVIMVTGDDLGARAIIDGLHNDRREG